ncbi:LLM class flavin-dependent oxidoreductase [Pseudonocardia sp.]|uniref:LLM class flavin-dependent oxidoreductase n=1 Tax=Pseudonocardia sp. TaxID=60912 RepID=UPI00262C301E|nr:LLM class flavin-dependent oxidoreductase [Pseudonocardia sp.]
MSPLAAALTPLETRRDVVLHLAVRAEELGYDEFLLAEGWGHDAAVLLAEVATRTSRIRIGTGVLNVWGRSPASLAMLATSLDAVSGGRFTLGLGAGSPQLAEGLHDVAFREPVARLGAVTRQVRALLDGARLAPSAPDRQRPLRLAVRPGARVPIRLAALGPHAVRLAGELADGWSPFLLPRSALKAGIGLLDEGAARAGRPPGGTLVGPCVPVAVSEAGAYWWVAFYLTSMGPLYRDTLRRLGFGAAVDAVLAAGPDAPVPAAARVLLDELTLHGDTAGAALDRWYGAGAQLPALTLPPHLPLDELDRLLTELAPGNREKPS